MDCISNPACGFAPVRVIDPCSARRYLDLVSHLSVRRAYGVARIRPLLSGSLLAESRPVSSRDYP